MSTVLTFSKVVMSGGDESEQYLLWKITASRNGAGGRFEAIAKAEVGLFNNFERLLYYINQEFPGATVIPNRLTP